MGHSRRVSRHRPRKRFGQHFLHDPGVIQRLIAAIDPRRGQRIVEIGPGLGALTEPILERTGDLDVVELDRDLAAKLAIVFQGCRGLRIHNADALDFDFAALAAEERGLGEGNQRLRIVGNLPYNVSTPLLFHLLAQGCAVHDMHLMLQREVVERIVSAPGGSDYGRLSVMVQLHCRTQKLFSVRSGAFNPVPRVASAVIRLTLFRHAPVAVADHSTFERLVARAFAQRRKTLRNSLRGVLSEAQIRTADVDPGARPEALSVSQFAALANELYGMRAGIEKRHIPPIVA